jgi:hypothetical protein
MPANDVYKVSMGFTQNGEKMAIVFYVQQTSSDAAGLGPVQCNSAIASIFQPLFSAFQANACHFTSVTSTREFPDAGGRFDTEYDEIGLLGTEVLPSQSNIVINLFTDLNGRPYRGRMHVPGLPIEANQDGVLTHDVVALFETLMTALCAPITHSGWTFRMGRFITGANLFYPYTSARLQTEFRTMRGRKVATI